MEKQDRRPAKPLNGYVCFYRGKRFEVLAISTYTAQQKCARVNNIKKSWEISVVLAEQDDSPVTHAPLF